MADLDTLKAEARKANARATQAKMDLHDLSEELPAHWERILEVAKVAHDAHVALMAARKQLADAQAAAA
ncbi:MAG TPA: CCE_0567 family metalloprotein [Burkholderiaceae bacterium]|nr:CCE_0567 family metalloprotein [Burkholderiaceae bacterium]